MQGVRVQGYCFWTISDNWEWADGYGPKFGLVAVDRHKNLARHPRPSYDLYAEVIIISYVLIILALYINKPPGIFAQKFHEHILFMVSVVYDREGDEEAAAGSMGRSYEPS